MKKLSYKLSYWQACVLRDYIFEVSTEIKPQAAFMLSAVLAINYGLKLSRKLVLRYDKTKTINIPYSAVRPRSGRRFISPIGYKQATPKESNRKITLIGIPSNQKARKDAGAPRKHRAGAMALKQATWLQLLRCYQ